MLTTLTELLLIRADDPRPALWVDEHLFSYRALIKSGFEIANVVAALPQRRTAIFAQRRYWTYAGTVGALLAGHAYVPLNSHHPMERLLSVLRRAAVSALVIEQNSLAVVRDWINEAPEMTVIVPDGDPPSWASDTHHRFVGSKDLVATPRLSPVQPDDGAYLLFTSGSTGEPKGVMVSHRNVMTYLHNVQERYGYTPDDRATQLFDLTFDLSVHDLFATWNAGASLYVPSEPVRKAPQRFVQAHKLTCWFSTPATIAVLSRMRMLQPNDFPSLRYSLFCGEALPKSLVARWQQAAPASTIENLYGPTEATIAITAYRVPADLSDLPEIVPIGESFPGHTATILGNELLLSGPQVTAGYWQQPDLTAERFITHEQRWSYLTGDRAVRGPHGLEFCGRLDRQVKIAGNRVELLEVETVLRKAADCDTVAALTQSVGGILQIIAMVPRDSHDDEDILAYCRRHLPSYMMPSRVIRVEWPLNSNTKTDYRALETLLENGA